MFSRSLGRVVGIKKTPVRREPGGKSLIVNEDDGLSGNNEKWEKMIDGMHIYTPDKIKAHLTAAGFQNITIHRKESKRWLALTAVK